MERCSRKHTLPLKELGLAQGRTWVTNKDLKPWSAHLERGQISIAAGARVRAEQSVTVADSSRELIATRFFVLDGPNAGNCFCVETDGRADLTRQGFKKATTRDEYWDMGPGQLGSDAFRCEREGSTVAHLYDNARPDDDPDYPRCGTNTHRVDTRPAVYGDDRCWSCERWYEQFVWMPMVA